MIHNTTIKNLIKTQDTIDSEHLVIAEWNMNKYQKISQYGVYTGQATSLSGTYVASASNIVDGKTFYIYDDDSTQESPESESYSNIASIFGAERPDPGIILAQYYPGTIMVNNSNTIRASKLSTASPRIYPFSENRRYDYFNSAKLIDTSITDKNAKNEYSGISTPDGAIANANPFVVYENSFPCNKILISVQNYRSVPEIFYVDILNTSSWTNIYSSTSSSVWDEGILEIYYNNGTWSKTVNRIDDISQIQNPTTEATNIKGIRLRVAKMSPHIIRSKKYKTSLELIEISPRVEADISNITEQFSFNSSIADGEFGLPVGKIVSSNGNIDLSNESGSFLYSSSISNLNMMTPDTEFRFFQTLSGSSIPLKTMYADKWNLNEDFTVSISLSDKMRIFQEINVIDMALMTRNGIPFSVVILTLLDNLGITGYEFKKSNNNNDKEDTRIKNFYCNREQTLAEVLERIAISTQSSMFIDASGNLNVLTKERITRSASITDSISTFSGGTDFWAVFEENVSVADPEYTYIQNYKSNVISLQEEKIDPVTEGTVTYHGYGIRKSPGQSLLKDSIPKNVLDEIPLPSIIGTGYDYVTRMLWSPGADNSAVLGAANLLKRISSNRLANLYTSNIVAVNKESAIQTMVNEALTNVTKREALLMYLDRNEIYTFIADPSGYVMVDNEIIEYAGILYSVSGSNTVIFSTEQLTQIINEKNIRGPVIPIALVTKPKLNLQSVRSDGLYEYKVIGDGRAALKTRIASHQPFTAASTGLSQQDRFAITLGGKPNKSAPGGGPLISTYYDFSKTPQINKLKKALKLPEDNYKTYLGYLKVAGRKSPMVDRKAASASLKDEDIFKKQQKINKDIVDKTVPGKEFDPYVYTVGETRIYGQKIDLGFGPSIIGTTMRLFSPKKRTKANVNEMTTNSSIAGIGFGLRTTRDKGKEIFQSGYFLEVETIGSGKNFSAKDAFKNNLRFYKVEAVDGKITPTLLSVAQVKAYTVANVNAEVVSGEGTSGDPVFDLEIRISTAGKGTEFKIYYGGQDVSPKKKIIDKKAREKFWTNSRNIFMFVRNDSEAIYENIYAAVKASGNASNDSVFKEDFDFENAIYRGSISQLNQYLFKNKKYKFYYNDFGKIVRHVKKYTPRYEAAVLASKVIDISRVNPKYMINSAKFTPFGGELIVTNTSNTAIALAEQEDLPLYIYGAQLEELTTGNVTLQDYFEKIDEDGKKITDLSFNKSVYGIKGFNIDSPFIQTYDQANMLMDWIIQNCSRERFKLSIEMFSNPLLELGDKVKIFSSERGYYINNGSFGNKTFVVSEINRSVTNSGPTMNVTLIEVGEK